MSKPLLRIDLPLVVHTSKKTKFILNLNNYRNTHYRTLSKAKHTYCDLICDMLKGRKGIKKQGLELEYTYHHGNARRVDVSNPLSIIDKFASDALVHAGILPDDNTNIIKRVIYQNGGIDRENPRAELRIYSNR